MLRLVWDGRTSIPDIQASNTAKKLVSNDIENVDVIYYFANRFLVDAVITELLQQGKEMFATVEVMDEQYTISEDGILVGLMSMHHIFDAVDRIADDLTSEMLIRQREKQTRLER